jgi:hypothetical protein
VLLHLGARMPDGGEAAADQVSVVHGARCGVCDGKGNRGLSSIFCSYSHSAIAQTAISFTKSVK